MNINLYTCPVLKHIPTNIITDECDLLYKNAYMTPLPVLLKIKHVATKGTLNYDLRVQHAPATGHSAGPPKYFLGHTFLEKIFEAFCTRIAPADGKSKWS